MISLGIVIYSSLCVCFHMVLRYSQVSCPQSWGPQSKKFLRSPYLQGTLKCICQSISHTLHKAHSHTTSMAGVSSDPNSIDQADLGSIVNAIFFLQFYASFLLIPYSLSALLFPDFSENSTTLSFKAVTWQFQIFYINN